MRTSLCLVDHGACGRTFVGSNTFVGRRIFVGYWALRVSKDSFPVLGMPRVGDAKMQLDLGWYQRSGLSKLDS